MEKEIITFSSPGLALHIQTCSLTANTTRGRHFHQEVEVVQISHGHLLCEIGQDLVSLTEGDILIINSGVIHHISYSGSPCTFTYLQIDFTYYLEKLYPEANRHLYMFINSNQLEPYAYFRTAVELIHIVEQIKAENTFRERFYQASLNACISLLLIYLCRHSSLFDYRKPITGVNTHKLFSAIDYIEASYKNKITLEKTAEVIGMDKYNLSKLFRSVTGRTFVEYVNFRRLKLAEHLLLTSQYSISAVAMESGFRSIQHFNKTFKKENGCTPAAYRRMYSSLR